jgi:hypothetical protein
MVAALLGVSIVSTTWGNSPVAPSPVDVPVRLPDLPVGAFLCAVKGGTDEP